MTDDVVEEQQEGAGLDDMIQEYEAEQAEAEAEAKQPDPEEQERARKLAEKMNNGFLWAVRATQCPHVEIDKVVDREAGNEAFVPLAERWGGEVPEWIQALLDQYQPYIAAGWYMGSAIYKARQAEAEVLAYLEAQRRKAQQHQQQQEPGNGTEPEPGTAE
ncbi:hypothetical protein [Marinobacter sp. LN3S78]|uniref:hypothetical protein n=1 Tax=Marinobacter sp. LN3S78 TaxID=3382300 RepID=UPI00387ACF30